MALTVDQAAKLRSLVRTARLDPQDFNLDVLQARAEELYAAGCSPLESYSRALGVDLTANGYEGPTMRDAERRATIEFRQRTIARGRGEIKRLEGGFHA